MGPVDPVIAAAAKVAEAKRSKPGYVQAAALVRNILGRPAPLSEADYCGACQYPLIRGRSGPCARCEEVREEEAKMRETHAQMVGGLRAWDEYRLSTFTPTEYNRRALSGALAFDWKTDNILFYGPSGTGKSHLAGIIKRRLVVNGVNVLTISMPEVVDELVANMKSQRFGNDWVNRLVRQPVLSIEDVGAGERMTEFVVKLYFRVIDGRYKANKPGLIVTTNHAMPELKFKLSRFDEPGRTVSRLEQMCRVFSLEGEKDWRKEPKLGRS